MCGTVSSTPCNPARHIGVAVVSQKYGDDMARMEHFALIALGGMVGALLRYGVVEAWHTSDFPWPTLLVNVVGSGLLGLVTVRTIPIRMQRLIAVGFCGGLTTFSTLSLEVVRLLDDGDGGLAVIYVVASVALGLAAFVAARTLGTSAPELQQ
jgi:CrcB protein